jgi:hypothetical protein
MSEQEVDTTSLSGQNVGIIRYLPVVTKPNLMTNNGSILTLSNYSLKSLESAEGSSKIISPDVASIHNTSKKVLSSRETTLDKLNSLGSTNKVKTISSHTAQRC